MKTSWKKSNIYKHHNSCLNESYFEGLQCFCDAKDDDEIHLIDFLRERSSSPHDKLFWLRTRVMNILEWEQLAEYFVKRYLSIYGLHISPIAVMGFYNRSRSPLLDVDEIDKLIKYLKLN